MISVATELWYDVTRNGGNQLCHSYSVYYVSPFSVGKICSQVMVEIWLILLHLNPFLDPVISTTAKKICWRILSDAVEVSCKKLVRDTSTVENDCSCSVCSCCLIAACDDMTCVRSGFTNARLCTVTLPNCTKHYYHIHIYQSTFVEVIKQVMWSLGPACLPAYTKYVLECQRRWIPALLKYLPPLDLAVWAIIKGILNMIKWA